MKAVLVMDIPENCDICPFCNNCDYTCEVFQIRNEKYTYEVPSDGVKPDWCPLRPMPEKMQVCGKYPQPDRIVPSYKIGWNACIDEIIGGKE